MSHLNINGVDKPLDHIRLNNVRSENLWSVPIVQGAVDIQGDLGDSNIRVRGEYIQVQPETQYTISCNKAIRMIYAYQNKSKVGLVFDTPTLYMTVVTFTTPANCDSVCVAFMNNPSTAILTPSDIEFVMLNIGSTAKPYYPYLINKEAWEAKSRVILHGLTNPLCGISTYKDTLDLSTGPLTRYIKKLVLTGQEVTWGNYVNGRARFVVSPLGMLYSTSSGFVISDRYSNAYTVPQLNNNSVENAIAAYEQKIYIYTNGDYDIDTYKAYLASEYANGTPVVIWYILTTPTTETITLPSNLTGIVEGYLTQTGTPTPSNPIYPTANGTLEQDGTYSLDTGAYAIAWGRADTFIGTNSISARCYGLPVKSWEIDGNSRQSETPAPDNIIMPEFVGERTGNLFDVSTAMLGKYINSQGIETDSTAPTPFDMLNHTDYIEIQPDRNYTYHYKYDHSAENTIALCWFDASKNLISRVTKDVHRSNKEYTLTGTSPVNAAFCIINFAGYLPNESMELSFNIGTTAKPYEPYGYAIQAYSSIQNTVSGQTPLTLTDSVGHNLISWDGEGATTSSGTPAPTSPITMSGWGDKTGNLFDEKLVVGFYNNNINTIYESPNYRSFRIQGLPSGQYTVSWNIPVRLVRAYYDGVLYENIGEGLTAYTVTSSDGDIAFSFRDETSTETPWSDYNTVMLNTGSTAFQYEPYGWKLSFTSAGQTTPVYLGQVSTTRKVRKWALTGEENWNAYADIADCYRLDLRTNPGIIGNGLCTHFAMVANTSLLTDGTFVSGQNYSYFKDTSVQNLDGWKAYLATQYATGTPVTIWYVLATPTTGIVNEPLMKIGDYADSITSTQAGVTIPTAKGNATLTTSNTVQPSTMHATYDKYISGGDVPVYLGQVPTTRKVEKLVLTGQEDWTAVSSDRYYYTLSPSYPINWLAAIISHFEVKEDLSTTGCARFGGTSTVPQNTIIFNFDNGAGGITSWKSYLAAQYAAGTPVTVWYVMAAPKTTIVNEPLCKIGDYADTLTSEQAGVIIPTTNGNNTISVDTTLAPSKFEVKVHAKPIHYGFKIDKSFSDPSDAVIYTHAAVTMTPAGMNFTKGVFDYGSWENIWFIKNARPVMLNFDGTEAYDLDPNDYSKKLDGTPSDIADSTKNMNAMIAFPTVWIKRTDDASYNYIEISDQQLDSDFHAYAHEDANGVVKPYIYLPIYKGSLVDGKLRSISGVKPQSGTTAQQEVDAASALGTGWQIWDYTSKEMLCDLLTLISKSLDTQGKFGQGHSTGGSSASDFLNCGTLNDKGKFFGYSATTSQVKCFGMEALWAERWDRELGLILDAGIYKIKEHPAYNLTGEGYTAINTSVAKCPTSNNYIKAEVSTQFGGLPTVVGGTSATYFCDYFYQNQSGICIAVRGGSCIDGATAGLRCVNVNRTASGSAWSIGASPVYK